MNTGILLAIPAAIVLVGCGQLAPVQSAGAPRCTGVSVITAAVQQWPSMYETTGTVRARSTGVVSAKWMGYVREVKAQVGDHVRAGQLLVTLDARDLDAGAGRAVAGRDEVRRAVPESDSAVAAAKANLDLAQSTFRRMSELYEKKSISDQEFDEASARMKGARAAYDMARAKRAQLDARMAQAKEEVRAAEVARSYAEVQAPFAGLVTARSVELGNLAAPGAPLFTIEGESYRLEAAVEESRLGTIRLGQSVSVSLDSGRSFDARISEIVPAVDAASRAYTVKIDLPAGPQLRSGMFGRARFPLGKRDVLAIPAGAVSERGQLQSIFVVDGGVARLRLLTLGMKTDGQVEALSGLAAGEKVVFPIPAGLADGARVEVRP
jgi:multidrug efflux pump subunit AcrA (membrane-fusion protein)